jgi:hypothetical protein
VERLRKREFFHRTIIEISLKKKSMFNESGDEKRTNKNSKVTVFAKIATFLLGLRKCKRQNEFSWDQS